MTSTDLVRPVIEPVVDRLGLTLEDLTVTPAGRRRVVRVVVDRAVPEDEVSVPGTPMSLDDVADATRAVSDTLDESDVLGDQPYVLEVSSPGVDRPLSTPSHFKRNVGRLVTLSPADGGLLAGPLTARITAADNSRITVEPLADSGLSGPFHVPYAAVAKAVVQVEFSRAPGSEPTRTPDPVTDSDTVGPKED